MENKQKTNWIGRVNAPHGEVKNPFSHRGTNSEGEKKNAIFFRCRCLRRLVSAFCLRCVVLLFRLQTRPVAMKFHRAVCGILLNSFYMHTQHGRPETQRLFMQQRTAIYFLLSTLSLAVKSPYTIHIKFIASPLLPRVSRPNFHRRRQKFISYSFLSSSLPVRRHNNIVLSTLIYIATLCH